MAVNNRKFYLKRGELGIVLTATLKEADNEPVDLTNWDAQLIVTARGSATRLIDAAMTVAPDQVANKGVVTYEFVEADVDLAAGQYDLEIVITDQGGNILKFPKLEKEAFGTLVVMESKYT